MTAFLDFEKQVAALDRQIAELREMGDDPSLNIDNDIARLEIASEHSAGAVQLLDKRWRRRAIGVITGSTADTAQPLLASNFYLARALNPFADVRLAEKGSTAEAVNKFMEQHVPMLILADVGNVVGEAHDQLLRWVESGGVLVRFAGPRLAASDTSTPTPSHPWSRSPRSTPNPYPQPTSSMRAPGSTTAWASVPAIASMPAVCST